MVLVILVICVLNMHISCKLARICSVDSKEARKNVNCSSNYQHYEDTLGLVCVLFVVKVVKFPKHFSLLLQF